MPLRRKRGLALPAASDEPADAGTPSVDTLEYLYESAKEERSSLREDVRALRLSLLTLPASSGLIVSLVVGVRPTTSNVLQSALLGIGTLPFLVIAGVALWSWPAPGVDTRDTVSTAWTPEDLLELKTWLHDRTRAIRLQVPIMSTWVARRRTRVHVIEVLLAVELVYLVAFGLAAPYLPSTWEFQLPLVGHVKIG